MSAADTEDALREAIAEDPLDEARQLVYADWLADRGHPHGERMHLQHRLARGVGTTERAMLQRRVAALARFPRANGATLSFDRGLPGLGIDPRRRAAIDQLRPRDLQLFTETRFPDPHVIDQVGDMEAMRDVVALRMHATADEWSRLFDGRARPRRLSVHLFGSSERLRFEGPLFERVRAFDMGMRWCVEPSDLEPLLAASWMRGVAELSLQHLHDACVGVLAAAKLPQVRALDLRYGHLTASSLDRLAASDLALSDLQLSIDKLSAADLASFERSRLVDVARLGMFDPRYVEPDQYAALVRSRAWRGDLYISRAHADLALGAIARVGASGPLHDLAVEAPSAAMFERFLNAPIARHLRHLLLDGVASDVLAVVARAPIQLESLWLQNIRDAPLQLFQAPSLRGLRQLAVGANCHDALAASALELEQLVLHGRSEASFSSEVVGAVPVLTLFGGPPSRELTSALIAAGLRVQHLHVHHLEEAPVEVESMLRAHFGERLQPGPLVELPG